MKKHFDNFIAGAINWLWRRRSKGLTLVRIGSYLLIALLGVNWVADITVLTPKIALRFSFTESQEPLAYLLFFSQIISVFLIVIGIILICCEERRFSKKKAIVIELRGLRDTTGNPLKDSIPRSIIGHREQLLLNIRRSDGRIFDPEEALQQVVHLPKSIAQFDAGIDRSDMAYIAGGLAPVPFSFLMGVLLDDECSVTLMDWDRTRDCWRSLDEKDDGDRFVINGMDQIDQAEEIVLSISVSYPTDTLGISQAFTGQPVVSMTLSNFAIDKHWSELKQAALAQQFFDLMRMLCGKNIKHVNLVLAAPNSVVIRFGRVYDKRNLPPLVVWQYERGQIPKYPWGVSMPVAGNETVIIRR